MIMLGGGVIAWAVALVRRDEATVVLRREVIGASILSTKAAVWRVEAVKAAAQWMAALRRPRPPSVTGSDAKIYDGSWMERGAPMMEERASHWASSKMANSLLSVAGSQVLRQ